MNAIDITSKTATEMKAPIFSVVMPAYNAEATLAESIDSILGQTCGDWEFLLVNNGSTDRTAEVCARYTDPRIRVFSPPENLKAAGAMNLALDHVRGEFVAFLDSDDLAAPTRLERQLGFFRANPAFGICGTHAETFRESGDKTGRGTIKHAVGNGAIKAKMFFYDPLVKSSISIRSSLLEKLGKPFFRTEFTPTEDYDFVSRLLDKTEFANIPETLAFYRVHPGQLTQTQNDSMRLQIGLVWKQLFLSLGLPDNERTVELHRMIMHDSDRSPAELKEMQGWLEQLWQAGLTRRFLPPKDWSKELGSWWFLCCERCERRDPGLWRQFRGSALARHFPSRRRQLAFMVSCVLGKQSGAATAGIN